VVRVTIGLDVAQTGAAAHHVDDDGGNALSKTKINAKGYHPAEVTDMEACIGCTSCARTCPDVVIRIEKD